MNKRTRNRILLVGGFVIALAIVVTIISLIIAAACGAFSRGNSTADIASVEVLYNTYSAAPSSSESTSSGDTSTTEGTADGEDFSSAASSEETGDTDNGETPEDGQTGDDTDTTLDGGQDDTANNDDTDGEA